MDNKCQYEELVFMGGKIISNFRGKISQGGDVSWREEAVISCEILLDYLSERRNLEKALLLSRIFEDRYSEYKPPVISHWCRKVRETLENDRKL